MAGAGDTAEHSVLDRSTTVQAHTIASLGLDSTLTSHVLPHLALASLLCSKL